MAAFLLYVLKSAFCLGVFYVVFRALLSRSTFFRFNRITLLAGMCCCILLPLLQFTTNEGNVLNVPFQTVQRALIEVSPSDILPRQLDGMLKGDTQAAIIQSVGASTSVSVVNHIIYVSGLVYLFGACSVLLLFLVSTIRMLHLIRGAEKRKFRAYTLVLTKEPVGSFSWGRTIVMSEKDYGEHPDEILLHEQMHLRNYHTLDLFFIQCFLIFQWFNPAVWLLRRELQEIHEYEADNGVINTGIDATRYQLLLVKKAVGTRLYSMANGFNHSKLKNRITMMLKERTNGWARLKLLLFVPVMVGALYAFGQPEVKEKLAQVVPEVKQEPSMDYLELSGFLRGESNEAFFRQFGSLNAEGVLKERQCHKLLMNARNQLLFNGDRVTKETLKASIVKALPDNQKKMMQKDGKRYNQIIVFKCDRGSNVDQVRQVLEITKNAFEDIRDSIAATSADKSKAYLDKVFPIYVVETEMKITENSPVYADNDKIEGIGLEVIFPDKTVKSLKEFTKAELDAWLKECSIELKKSEKLPHVSMKIDDKNCKMGAIAVVKKALGKVFPLTPGSSLDKILI